MSSEDVIELGSSDEEPEPPPEKKMKTGTNAMVHIPRKIHGVTIKPVKASENAAQKLLAAKGITITKVSKPKLPLNIVDKTIIQKGDTKITKKKITPIRMAPNQNKTVFNPLSTLKNINSSLVVRKTGPTHYNIPIQNISKVIPKLSTNINAKKPISYRGSQILAAVKKSKALHDLKKSKIGEVLAVEIDQEASVTSSPQWYLRPEETGQQPSLETTNNQEPEAPKFIEITIEDSPVKPTTNKRTRELSTEKVITIDDSPNKGGTENINVEKSEDSETNTENKKIPNCKKKIEYAKDLKTIHEIQTVEIEFEPIIEEDSSVSLNTGNDKEETDKQIIVEIDEPPVKITKKTQQELPVNPPPLEMNKEQSASQTTDNALKPDSTNKALKPDSPMTKEFIPEYQNFIDLCLKLENSDDMKVIIEKKIKPYYRQCPKTYTSSEHFIDMVSSKISSMKAAPEKMFLYIKDIVDELNLQRKLAKQTPVSEIKPENQESALTGKDSEFDSKRQRQLRKLEKTLKKLHRAIQKLEMQEVDFDDEEDSVYLLTEKYKERMVRVHAKFCQLMNSKMPSMPRLVIEVRPGQPAGPVKRLETWINKKVPIAFPDFHDVLRCVREANEEDKLGWTELIIQEEARDLFIRCGKKLQRRRQEEEWRLATSRLSLDQDPAEMDEELKKQLEINRKLANMKETDVFNKFADRQNQLKLEGEEFGDREAEESPVDSEEDDNSDESQSLENKQKRKERLKRLLEEQSKKNSDKLEMKNVEESCNVIEDSEGSVAKQPTQTANEDDDIQSLSDNSIQMGSDVDELHLLQKLHSVDEVNDDSTIDSSDSESPIAISDTLESGSDVEGKKEQCDVISIENSSYSDESNSSKAVTDETKINKNDSVAPKDLLEESVEIECSSFGVVKNVNVDFIEEPLNISSTQKHTETDVQQMSDALHDLKENVVSETRMEIDEVGSIEKASDETEQMADNSNNHDKLKCVTKSSSTLGINKDSAVNPSNDNIVQEVLESTSTNNTTTHTAAHKNELKGNKIIEDMNENNAAEKDQIKKDVNLGNTDNAILSVADNVEREDVPERDTSPDAMKIAPGNNLDSLKGASSAQVRVESDTAVTMCSDDSADSIETRLEEIFKSASDVRHNLDFGSRSPERAALTDKLEAGQ